jgi:hypothetical protein
MTLTQQIIADAKALGLTRVEIAAICGVRLATVTDWGYGRIDPLANIGPLLVELDRVAARAAKKQKGQAMNVYEIRLTDAQIDRLKDLAEGRVGDQADRAEAMLDLYRRLRWQGRHAASDGHDKRREQ